MNEAPPKSDYPYPVMTVEILLKGRDAMLADTGMRPRYDLLSVSEYRRRFPRVDAPDVRAGDPDV